MGQQPNIELEIADLPRPVAHPAPPKRWSPKRPGELGSPTDVPWGGMFGTAGPDTGYAMKLLGDAELPMDPGEHRSNVVAGLAAIAGARASRYGRAPTPQDVEVAMLILGYRPDGLPGDLIATLAADRVEWLANIAHDPVKARKLVASIPLQTLAAVPEELRTRMAGGERLIHR